MITVRQATLADRPAIFDFIRQAYAGRWEYKIPKRWEWEYVDNPFLEKEELPIWIAVTEDGQVVGQTCAMVEPLKLGDEVFRMGWSVDTFLLPEYRGQGLGYRLQKANDEANPLFMSLSMSAANRRIKIKQGSIPLPPVTAYERPIRYRPDAVVVALQDRLAGLAENRRQRAAHWFQRSGLQHGLAAWMTWRTVQADRNRFAGVDPNIKVVKIDSFGEGSNALWQSVSPHFQAGIVRDHTYLNWKYVHQPHADYIRLAAHQNGRMCGHLILRRARPPEPEVGIFADIFADPDDSATLLALSAAGIRHLHQAGVAYLTAATSVPAYQKALRAMGFRKTKDVIPTIHYRPLPGAADLEPASLNWLLGRGDHDWDQYPNA
jgi:GNAT superfamily N-acetyltransferase